MLAIIFSTYDNYQERYKKINMDRITVHSNRGGHRQCKSCIVNNIQVARDGRRARLDSLFSLLPVRDSRALLKVLKVQRAGPPSPRSRRES